MSVCTLSAWTPSYTLLYCTVTLLSHRALQIFACSKNQKSAFLSIACLFHKGHEINLDFYPFHFAVLEVEKIAIIIILLKSEHILIQ